MPSAPTLVRPQQTNATRFFLCEEGARPVVSTAAAAEDDRDLEDGVLEFDGEEVEDGNGDEAGDGLECPECEPESQDVKTGPFTYKPTPAEVELHRLTHWPYRSWCE